MADFESKIIRFYTNQLTAKTGNSDYKLAAILSWDDGKLEDAHDYIQWLFPSREKSRYNKNAPLLNDHDIDEFKQRPDLKENVRKSVVRMLNFYGWNFASNRLDPIVGKLGSKIAGKPFGLISEHNFLRCTRIMKFLTMIGDHFHSSIFFHMLLRSVMKNQAVHTLVRAHEDTMTHWISTQPELAEIHEKISGKHRPALVFGDDASDAGSEPEMEIQAEGEAEGEGQHAQLSENENEDDDEKDPGRALTMAEQIAMSMRKLHLVPKDTDDDEKGGIHVVPTTRAGQEPKITIYAVSKAGNVYTFEAIDGSKNTVIDLKSDDHLWLGENSWGNLDNTLYVQGATDQGSYEAGIREKGLYNRGYLLNYIGKRVVLIEKKENENLKIVFRKSQALWLQQAFKAKVK